MQIISSQIILFIGGIGFQEVLLIALVVLLFFGGKKIPELMKGLGKGVRSFKEGMNEVEEIKDETKAESRPEKKGEPKEEQ
ncbi:MAG: twin-arginine translocase TatA/TatE family subunit [Prevotella sp.]